MSLDLRGLWRCSTAVHFLLLGLSLVTRNKRNLDFLARFISRCPDSRQTFGSQNFFGGSLRVPQLCVLVRALIILIIRLLISV